MLSVDHQSLKSRHLKLLILLIAIDGITKAAAFALLDDDAAIALRAPIQLVLRVNYDGLGNHATEFFAGSDRSVLLLATILYDAVLGASLLIVSRKSDVTVKSAGIWMAAAAVVGLAGSYLAETYSWVSGTDLVFSAKFTQTALWGAIWFVSRGKLWRLGSTIVLAAALGNLLSYVYPPYRPVDFIWSAPIAATVGYGVFNLADAFLVAGFPVIVVALVKSLAASVLARWRLRKRAARVRPSS